MALTRLNAFTTGSVVTNSIITGEFDNIYNNALTLISPLTANLAAGGFTLTGLGLGSASSPSLQFTGDTNTGVYSSAADALDLSVGGSRHLTLVGGTPVAGVAIFDPSALTATASTSVARLLVANTAALTIPTGTTAVVAGLRVEEPNITATGTVTAAATAYIEAAPTEGTSNYALWIDAGTLLIDDVGPHAIGGARNADVGLLISGTGAAGQAMGVQISSTTTPATTESSYGLNVIPTLTEFSSGLHPNLAGINIAPTVTAGVGTLTTLSCLRTGALTAQTGTTNAAAIYVSAAPTGATNNYGLWVGGGNSQFEEMVLLGTSGSDPGSTLQYIGTLGASSTIFRYNVPTGTSHAWQEAGSIKMQLISSILALGTGVTTSAGAGDFVQPNAAGGEHRWVNAAGNDTVVGIGLNASDRVELGGGAAGTAGVHINVILTASLPAAAAAQDGRILIEDGGVGDRNIIIYAGGQRFRIDGGANV